MRIAFLTPSFHTLEPGWWRFPQVIKLAAPTLAGYLREHGFTDLTEHDFEVRGFDALRADPRAVSFTPFFDDAAVDGFLAGGEPFVRAQAERVLELMEVGAADLYALSCASVIGGYAEMHAVGNLCLCLAHLVKEAHPGCTTVVGGLQISPDSKHRDEYRAMFRRCPALDLAVAGKGEVPLAAIACRLAGRDFAHDAEVLREAVGGQVLVHWDVNAANPEAGGPPDDGARGGQVNALTPGGARRDDAPEGSHRRRVLTNPSVLVTPWFDRRALDERATTSAGLLERYHLQAWSTRLAARADDRVLVVPLVFQEGCNARCAFCGYSMTSMERRDPAEVVRALAHLRETLDVRYFHFLNTNINGSYAYAERFCDELKAARLDLLWSDCANLRAVDEKLLVKARESGAVRFTWGLEYPSDRLLKVIHKGITVRQAEERLRLAHDLGFWNQLLLITGLPTETETDLTEFVAFLERNAPVVDGFNVSPFYLISSSLMGTYPERYGLRPCPNERGLLEDAAFDEIGGLAWDAKRAAIAHSTRVVTDALQRLKPEPKYWAGSIDLELLFLLYDRLGHARKAEIVAAFEEGFLGAPVHEASYRAPLARLAAEPAGPLAAALAARGWRAAPERLRFDQGHLVLPLEGDRHGLDLHVRRHARGMAPLLAGGEDVGVHAVARPAFAAALARLLAPGQPFEGAVTRAGWQFDAREVAFESDGLGFRLKRVVDGARLDAVVSPLTAGRPAALAGRALGFSYRAVEGSASGADDPRVTRFVLRMGRYVLDTLEADPSTASSVPFLDAAGVIEVARQVVEGLEAPLQADYERDRQSSRALAEDGRAPDAGLTGARSRSV
jgi:radical SAM superfamily enzyme YgiQ (UPF0313 family)